MPDQACEESQLGEPTDASATDAAATTLALIGCQPDSVLDAMSGWLILFTDGGGGASMPKLLMLESDRSLWSIDFRFPNVKLIGAAETWVRENGECICEGPSHTT